MHTQTQMQYKIYVCKNSITARNDLRQSCLGHTSQPVKIVHYFMKTMKTIFWQLSEMHKQKKYEQHFVRYDGKYLTFIVNVTVSENSNE